MEYTENSETNGHKICTCMKNSTLSNDYGEESTVFLKVAENLSSLVLGILYKEVENIETKKTDKHVK